MALIEDLERLQLRLQLEAAFCDGDSSLSKRLGDLAIETTDALEKVKAMACDVAAPQPSS